MAQNTTLPKILGINQLADETSLAGEEEMFVRSAVNVDIDNAGNISRRKGATLEKAGSGYHSLFASSRGWLMAGYKNELGVYTPSTATFTALITMEDAYRISFVEANGNLYASTPSFSCMFTPGSSVAKPIGVPLPTIEPEFSVLGYGDLEEGTYGVAYTIVDPDGEESGLSDITFLEVGANGGIQGILFSVATDYKYRVYLTTANGDLLRQAIEFDADQTTIQVLVAEEGRRAETQGLEPLHYGHIIRAFNSRLLVADSNTVYFSEAFRPHLAAPTSFVSMASFITMMEAVGSGVYVADRGGVRFFRGEDPTTWVEEEVSPLPVVYGTSTVVPGSFFTGDLAGYDEIAVWLSTAGYMLGSPRGEVVKLNAAQLKLPSYVQGCVASRVSDGRKQLITPVNSNVLADANVALDSTTI